MKEAVVDEIRTNEKRGPFDFALWKLTEKEFESPFGKGVPGWHAECVAMPMDNLGETIDIHWGGKDLIYPHHECESLIAKTLTGKTFVRYWVQYEFVLFGGEKMSKSTGGRIFIRSVLERFSGETLRTWILSENYRTRLEFSEEALRRSKTLYEKIRRAAAKSDGGKGWVNAPRSMRIVFSLRWTTTLRPGKPSL
ncbi:MAG: class I tRNA ligase family protein [Candidatus Methanomethylicaceae archaeon]